MAPAVKDNIFDSFTHITLHEDGTWEFDPPAGFAWVAKSNDGAYNEKSQRTFATQAEAYNDMRQTVLDKMKWNTEYDEDFGDGDVPYTVVFSPEIIFHASFSGVYVYRVVPAKDAESIHKTDEKAFFADADIRDFLKEHGFSG